MPKLDTSLHLDMFEAGKGRRSWGKRLRNAYQAFFLKDDVYGLEWGDPESAPPLKYVKNHFLMPYLKPETTVLEIGPGGGRWMRYMTGCKRIYAVDYHPELLHELKKNFRSSHNITYIQNHGSDFPDVPDGSIDFLFSFGVFVHLDLEIVDAYLKSMKRLLHDQSVVVIQYSDKTKPMAKKIDGFSENDPATMRNLVSSHGYAILEEDTQTMWHSSIIRFALPK